MDSEMTPAMYFEFEVKDDHITFFSLQEDDKGGQKLTARSTRPATEQEKDMWAYILRTWEANGNG